MTFIPVFATVSEHTQPFLILFFFTLTGDTNASGALSSGDQLQQGRNIMDTEGFVLSLSSKHFFFFKVTITNNIPPPYTLLT